MRRFLLLLVLALTMIVPIGTSAQEAETPIVVYISWDGSPGWVVDHLLEAGKLPNIQKLIDMGVHVHNTVGQWPSLTAASHAAVFGGAYGNVTGITGNSIPAAPFDQFAIGTSGVSGYSSASLLTEPIWITAAKQSLKSSLVSVTQSSPFEMYTDAAFVSTQSAPSFGAFGDFLSIVDGYATRSTNPGSIVGGGENGPEITDTDGASWTNLPEGATFRAFTLGGGNEDPAQDAVLNGLLVATDGTTYDHIALSADGDYSTATILRATPFANDSSQMSDPVWVTICANDRCGTGYAHLRLTELAEDGSSFTLWHTYLADLTGHVTANVDPQAYLEAGGAFTGNGPFLPSPFTDSPELPNIYGELAFTVNDWFFNNLVAEIERNENDLYFSYSPYPDEWHHSYYSYMDENSPKYTEEAAALAWSYDEAIYGNLDTHLGNVMTALDGTGRPWNIVLFTDHGFTSAWNYVYPNRILAEAGLLVLDAEGKVDPAQTKAYFGAEGAGGVHINTVDGQLGGIVTAEEYDTVVQQVTDALLAATDPETGDALITAVYEGADYADEGLGGANNADLYLELAYGYYWNTASDEGAVAAVAPPFVSGIHGPRPSQTASMQGFAVLGGANFADGVSVDSAKSIDLTPTTAQAVGIEPAAHWVGEVHADWIAE